MHASSSARWHRQALVGFLVLDLLGLLALLADQLFSSASPWPWLIAAAPVLVALPLLGQAADYLLAPSEEAVIVPNTGEKIP